MKSTYFVNCIENTNLSNLLQVSDYYLIKVGDSTNLKHRINYNDYLSNKEKERASKFIFEKDREVYCISHAALKRDISTVLGVSQENTELNYFSDCKPFVSNNKIDFNLTHSGKYFAYAISKSLGRIVGIDLEIYKEIRDIESIAENFYHRKEIDYVFEFPKMADLHQKRFLEIWTRKEAFLKCLGLGITEKLTDICMIPGENMFQLDVSNPLDYRNTKFEMRTAIEANFVLSFCTNSD